jgi:hypothetical protein
MKHSWFCLLLICALQSGLASDATKLAPEDRQALREATQFQVIAQTANLPRGVLQLCTEGGVMAEPGQNWQVTDVISPGPPLPGSRLIWAVKSEGYFVVHYERGGIAHLFCVLVAKLPRNGGPPNLVWRGEGRPLKDYHEFLAVLEKGDGRGGYAH